MIKADFPLKSAVYTYPRAMYRLSNPRFVLRRAFYGIKPSSPLQCTVTKPEDHSLEEDAGQISSDTKASKFNFNSVLLSKVRAELKTTVEG